MKPESKWYTLYGIPSSDSIDDLRPHHRSLFRPPSGKCWALSNRARRYQSVYYGTYEPPSNDRFSLSSHLTILYRKIPWRLSRHQKLRHRQRMRRVDHVVSILDTALQRQHNLATQQQSQLAETSIGEAGIPIELSTATAEGQRLPVQTALKNSEERRHGRGPKQGDYVPAVNPVGKVVQGKRLLRDVVRETGTTKLLERWKAEMPNEQEMLSRDKYTMFDKKVKGYRKGVHKLPKWTRMSQRLNPPGF